MLSSSPASAVWPTAKTRLFVVFGDPVAHSLSPVIHNAAFRSDGLDCVYLAWFAPKDAFAATVAVCRQAGVAGANVTVPHKTAALGLCDTLSDDAVLIGAVNTLVFSPDGIHGDNTDVGGFGDDLDTFDCVKNDTPVVVFGTGGAARAVVVALARRHAQVHVVGRRVDAANDLVALAKTAGAANAYAYPLDAATLSEVVGQARVVINATSLGLAGEALPDVFMTLTENQLAYDLIYAPAITPFLAQASAHGAATQNGLAMLINQAARAYTLFTGNQAPIAVMRDALTQQLG
jgi:shikimate dehydrogenase